MSDVDTPEAPVEEVSDQQETPAPSSQETPIVDRVAKALTPPTPQNPGSWSAVRSAPGFDKLSDEQKSNRLNEWTESQMNFAKQSGQFDPDTYKSIRDFSDEQRKQLGPSGLAHTWNLAKQLGGFVEDVGASIVGNAFGLTQVGQELGSKDQPYSESLGINARLLAQNAEASVGGSKLGGGQNAAIVQSINDLKTKIDSGELDAGSVKAAAEAITTANAQRFGLDPSLLKNIPEFNPASTRNLGMLKKYADTGDPTYFDQFKRWVTANPSEAPAHAEVDRLLGGQDNWSGAVQHLTGSPALASLASVAQQGSVDPVGVSLLPLASAGGVAGKVVNSAAGMGALGAGLEALDPNASTSDIVKAGVQQAAVPLAIHGITRLADLHAQKATLEADTDPATAESRKAAVQAIQLQIEDREKQLALPAPVGQPGEEGFVLQGERGNVIRDERPASPPSTEEEKQVENINKTFPPAQRFLALEDQTAQPGETGFALQSTSNKNVIRDEGQAPANVSSVVSETGTKSIPESETAPVAKDLTQPSPNEQVSNAGGTTEAEIALDPLAQAKDDAAKGLWDIGVHRPAFEALGEELENAKTPEEVAAVKAKIDAVPKDATNGYDELDPLTKTVVDEARKGNDVSDLPLQNQREAAEFLNKNKESQAAQKAGYNAASGKEIGFRQLSEDFARESHETESNLTPDQKASVQSKLADAESAFGPEAAERLKAGLKNPEDADQIMAAAREKYRRQLLNNPEAENISPIMVRDSVVRDYFDKVKAREDIQKESLQTPVGEEGTTKADLTKGADAVSSATPEEQTQIVQNAVDKAALTPEEKEILGRGAMTEEEAAKWAAKKGMPVTAAQATQTSAARKLAEAMREDIQSGKITIDDAKDTISNVLQKGLPPPTSKVAAAKPTTLKADSSRQMTSKQNTQDFQAWVRPFELLDPDVAQPFLKAMPLFRRAGIYADRVHVIKDGKWDTGESVDLTDHPSAAAGEAVAWAQRDEDGTPRLIINADELAKIKADDRSSGQLAEFDAWLNKVTKHEAIHLGVGSYIQKWGMENGFKDYGAAEEAFTKAIKPELQSLKVKGTNLWDLTPSAYGDRELSDVLKMHEATRMLLELRATGEITEQLGRPQYANGLRRLVQHLYDWFKGMPESPYTNDLLTNVEQQLGLKPISGLPFGPIENDAHTLMGAYGVKQAPGAGGEVAAAKSPQLAAVVSPKPPEANPLGKLSEEISKMPEVRQEESLGQKIDKARELGVQNPQGNKILNGIMAGVKVVRDEMTQAPKYGNAERAIGETDWAIGDHVRQVQEFSKDISSKYSANGKKGISFYNIFGQDPEAIRIALSQMKPENPNYDGLRAALKLTDQDKEIAGHVKNFYDDWGNTLVEKGAIGNMIEDYAQNMKWVKDPAEVAQLLGEVQSGKWRTDSNYFKKRILNPQDEIIKGRQLGNSDIAEAVKDYSTSASRALFTREAIGKTLETKEADGRPTVAPYSARNTTNLDGYKIVQHPAMRGYKIPAIDSAGNSFVEDGPLAVHPDAYSKINNWLNNISPIQKNALGKAALAVNAGVKEIRYASPIYHTATEALHSAIHGVNPFRIKPIDYNNPWEIEKMQHGLMTQPQSFDWNAAEGVGAYKGRVLPAIEKWGGKVPVVGQAAAWTANKVAGMQRWLFEKYIPNLMSQAFDNIYSRNSKWYPDLSHDDNMYLTAKQVNSGFLGPNTNMLGRSPVFRDSLRLAVGAPAFNEGRLRFLGGAFTKYGGENRRALGILGVASYVAARAFNQWYNGDSYTNKPFSFIANGKEIKFRHVLGDALELSSSAIPMMASALPKGTLAPVAKALPFLNDASGTSNYVKNRMSPIAHVTADPSLGLTDYRGQQVGVKDALMNFATSTLPLGASQAIQGELPKGLRSSSYSPKSWEDDLMTGLGVNSKDYGAYQAMYDKGSNFAAAEGKPRETGQKSDYSDLKWELRHGDMEGATKELQSLLETHSYGKIVKSLKASVKAPFTGSSELEPQFVQSLSPYEKGLYNEAVTERRNTLIKLQQLGNKLQLNSTSGYHAMPKGQRQAIINQELQTK